MAGLIQFGEITALITAKRFGFIRPDAVGDDFFFHMHMSECRTFKSLREGHRVSFLATRTPKGLRAEVVALAG